MIAEREKYTVGRLATAGGFPGGVRCVPRVMPG